MSTSILSDSMSLTEFVNTMRNDLPNFYGQIEHQPANETILELHDLVGCNESYDFDEDTDFEHNSALEHYLHTLYTAIKPKIQYIESLYA